MYKDEDEDVISPEGANRFFDDLNVSLEGVSVKTFLAARCDDEMDCLFCICLLALLDSTDCDFLEAQCHFDG